MKRHSVDTTIMHTIKEWHVDLVLLILIHGSKEFRSFLVRQLGIPVNPNTDFITASHSVRDWENRESDLEVLFKFNTAERIAILIEDKIDAQYSGDQDKRYRRRIDEGIQSGQWNKAITCLVAPKSYLSEIARSDWDHQIAIEDISTWLKNQNGDDPYLPCFDQILETAVKKKENIQGVKKISEPVTAFFKSYYTYCNNQYPDVKMYPLIENKTLNAYNWPWFGYGHVPSNQGVQIYHKPKSSHGSWVEMRVQYCTLDHFNKALETSRHFRELKVRIPDVMVVQRKRSKKAPSVYIKVKVETVDIRESFHDQLAAIDDALKKATLFVRF